MDDDQGADAPGGAVAPVIRISGTGRAPALGLGAVLALVAGGGLLVFGGKGNRKMAVYLILGGIALALRGQVAEAAEAAPARRPEPGEGSIFQGGQFAPGSGAGR